MKIRWENLRERLRASLWLVPGLLALGAALLAQAALIFDGWLNARSFDLPLLYPGGLEDAHQVLGTLAGSMISLTTISFSVMMVVLTLASNQFGPRVLRNFTTDRFYQVVLGVFVATFAFCLLVLGRLPHAGGDEGDVPRVTVTLALALAFGCLATLIAFIHHVARSIQASQIVLRAHEEARRTISTLFPDELDHEADSAHGPALDDQEGGPTDDEAGATIVRADRAGYIQALGVDELTTLAEGHDVTIALRVKPGEFVATGTALAHVNGSDGPLAPDFEATLRGAVILGPERTGEQDPCYGLRQLMEVAIRSLSPGINDPITALACIDYVGENLLVLAHRIVPASHTRTSSGIERVVCRQDGFPEIAASAFDNLRHYARGHPEVMIGLADLLRRLASTVERSGDVAWTRQALATLQEESVHLDSPTDRRRFEERCEAAEAALVHRPLHAEGARRTRFSVSSPGHRR